MTEIWKDIEGFEGRYQISNLGNVKSVRYGGNRGPRNLVPKVNNHGYEWVELFNKGEKKCIQIHRLVASAFIPNPRGCPIINHKDENPRNNRVDNLEWCDYEYNVRYTIDKHKDDLDKTRYRYGKKKGVFGAYKHSKPIAQVDNSGNVIKIWDYAEQVYRVEHKSSYSIIQCCEGKRKTAYGYTWHYVDAI